AVGVAIVRGCREEEPVLEADAEVADRASELCLDAVAAAAGRRCVVRLVEDQEASGKQGAQPLAHRVRIRGVDQEVVRDEETAVRTPGIHSKPALTTSTGEVRAVENLEHESEPF